MLVYLGEDLLDKPGDLSDRESEAGVVVLVVPDVTDVPVSPASVVTEFCVVSSFCSDWGLVVPKSFSFSKKRAHCGAVTQEEVRFESSQVKAPPLSRRRMMPAKFVCIVSREAGALRGETPDLECA